MKQLWPFQVIKFGIIGSFGGPAYEGKMEVHVGPQDYDNAQSAGCSDFKVYPVHSTPGGQLELPGDTISDNNKRMVYDGALARFQGKLWTLCCTYQCNDSQCIVMELCPEQPTLYVKYERLLRYAKSQAKRRWCLSKMRKYRLDTTV